MQVNNTRISVALAFCPIPAGTIDHKLDMIREMGPTDINDFVPLLELELFDLKRVGQQTKAERNVVPNDNRIYYFCDNLKVSITVYREAKGKYIENVSKNYSWTHTLWPNILPKMFPCSWMTLVE